MSEIDSPRPKPRPVRPGRVTSGLAAATVVLVLLFITLVSAPTPGTQGDPAHDTPPETFTAIGTFVASSPSATPAPRTATSPADPTATPVASPSLTVDVNHVATRVRVPKLGIDLAVVAPPKNRRAYPMCGVAMYLAELHQPGEDGATYLYAHARKGMFLPLYERAIQRLHGGPKSLLGLSVEVFTSDNLRYVYRIDEVRLHQTSLDDAARAKADELWLQTSEGPKGTRGKTQVRALAVDVKSVTDRQAHPTAKPVACG